MLDDPAWPIHWNSQRQFWFDLARDAIAAGVLYAWARLSATCEDREPSALPTGAGFSNLVMRTAGLDPHWPRDAGGTISKGIDLRTLKPLDTPDPQHALWLDRARVFQTAISRITSDFGAVDSAINDLAAQPDLASTRHDPTNYCERQGRGILGCLPDARQTLSRQLMQAMYGVPPLAGRPARPPQLPNMALQALAEVDRIRARPEGGYEVHYVWHAAGKPDVVVRRVVTADVVIVAAGCVNTNAILLRSKAAGGLPNLSDWLGFGFSTNGDSLQFLRNTRERIYLTRGPTMTSYGRFHSPTSGDGPDPARFHAIEDNGIPRAFAWLVDIWLPAVQWLAQGQSFRLRLFLASLLGLWFFRYFIPKIARAALTGHFQRDLYFRSADESLANMLCVATMGRDQALGQFRLGDPAQGDTALRVRRTGGKPFYQDPIYHTIRGTLLRFADMLTGRRGAHFENPFFELGRGQGKLRAPVSVTHPLGGCRMAAGPAAGVVDEFGRVFDASANGSRAFYPGLYVTDASIIPTALGVNPALTISTVALRAADQLVKDWYPLPEQTQSFERSTPDSRPGRHL